MQEENERIGKRETKELDSRDPGTRTDSKREQLLLLKDRNLLPSIK